MKQSDKNADYNMEEYEGYEGYDPDTEGGEPDEGFDDVQTLPDYAPPTDGLKDKSKRRKGSKKKSPQRGQSGAPKSGNTVTILISAFVALIVAGALFAWMVMSWRNTSIQVAEETRAISATAEVLMASNKLEKNTVLDVNTINNNFYQKTVYADSVPEGAIVNASELLGLTMNRDIPQGAIITQLDVTNYGNIVDENTVEISFPAASISNAVAGQLRPGERININMLTDDAYTPVYTTSIYKMYDGVGNEVKTAAEAGIYSILVPAEDSANFYTSISNGSMFIERLFV